MLVQVAFVGHDAGHNAVAHNSKYDGYIGLLVNACIGIGPSWWKASHLPTHITLPCPALPCPALPCPALPCSALAGTALACTCQHCPAQPCPALPCPALPCAALHCPALPCTCHPALASPTQHCPGITQASPCTALASHSLALHCGLASCTQGASEGAQLASKHRTGQAVACI